VITSVRGFLREAGLGENRARACR